MKLDQHWRRAVIAANADYQAVDTNRVHTQPELDIAEAETGLIVGGIEDGDDDVQEGVEA